MRPGTVVLYNFYFYSESAPGCGPFDNASKLLQTLNILFENLRHETSLFYLLSNNHVNSILTGKFDFEDEELLAYYISFLKTLSLRLDSNTVHFFFNEHRADFPLFTEGSTNGNFFMIQKRFLQP